MAKPIPGNTSIAEGKTNAEILAENFPILPDTASGKVVTERPKPALAHQPADFGVGAPDVAPTKPK